MQELEQSCKLVYEVTPNSFFPTFQPISSIMDPFLNDGYNPTTTPMPAFLNLNVLF
jgi:hypothetical protein